MWSFKWVFSALPMNKNIKPPRVITIVDQSFVFQYIVGMIKSRFVFGVVCAHVARERVDTVHYANYIKDQ